MVRDPAAPELDGVALYADFCGKWIGGFRYADGLLTDSVAWESPEGQALGTPLSFGVDGDGGVYLLTAAEGMIYRISTR